ncbi:uncharacterized protein [Amphiura filiformis]|uniref:uncharacterized protein n=1 Tax=Amphiura filiformis TaxID=82378 RepID=UPI003B21DF39
MVHKIDVTVLQTSPLLVDLASNTDAVYKGFLSNADRSGSFNIGRTSDTGPGDRGTEVEKPSNNIDNAGFPSGSRVTYDAPAEFRRINVILEGDSEGNERIGAFYVKAVAQDGGDTVKITTIKRLKQATIKSSTDTKTVSIGDSVDLEVSTNIPFGDLRWRHNEQPIIAWNSKKTVTITHVRKADAGIYECHQDGKREDGLHAIMRLIVRACPKGKYGSDCLSDCDTCYNGGICEESTGVCVCRPGFQGEQCETPCGNNLFGGTCSIICTNNVGGNCRDRLFCVPDPVGCSCTTGYMGEICDAECPPKSYGANCELTCHCGNCDNAKGCGVAAKCDNGYGGDRCQVPDSCPVGYSGALCDIQCHCKNYNTCTKATGVCADYECADGWGGNDCQQALPALYEFKPQIIKVSGATLTIQWNAWDANIDYGTGPVEKYQIYLAQQGQTLVPVAESTNTEEEITGLWHETTYDFALTVFRNIISDDMSEKSYEGIMGPISSATTTCGVPQAPTITSATVKGPYSVQLEWTIPEGSEWIKCTSGISAFVVTYGAEPEKIEDSTARNAVIGNLNPCTEYQFSIQAENKDNAGSKSNVGTATTAPKKVSAMSVISTSSEILQVTWTHPSTCVITDYVVSHRLTLRDQCLPEKGQWINETTEATSVDIDGLEAYSTYEIAVSATFDGVSGEPEITNGITNETATQGQPSNITQDLSEDMTLTCTWEQPVCGSRGGVITKYEYAFGLEGGETTYGSTEPDNREASFANLDYYKEYQFQVRGDTSVGAGPYSEVTKFTTPESYPDAPPEKIEPGDENTKGQLSFSWQPPPEDNCNGVITLYEYQFDIYSEAMVTDWAVNGTTEDTYATFEDLPYDTQFQFRIRALTSVGPGPFSQFIIARTSSSASVNVALQDDEVAPFGETSSDDDRLKPRAIVTPVVPIVSYPRDKPVLVEDFINYVKTKRFDAPDHELSFDYKALPTHQQSAMTFAKKEENATKNRYINTITYDHSRVCLEPLEGDPHSDYINASYIDGYRKPNAYIASQGPNSQTVNDMWRMIWQENTQTIIMATKCIEGPKKQNDADKREIKQFHFTGWPDMQAPEFAGPVLRLLEEVNKYNPASAGPVVVHCSAGVGRTGTFITIDSMLKMAKAEGKLDIFNFVCEMRSRRVHMIQTEPQYEFVHDALLEALFCTGTTIENADMERTWARVNRDETWLSNQHGALEAMFPAVSVERCTGATKPENVAKNRYPDRIPPDSSRPYLMSTSDSGGNNYINATFCNGYSKNNMYLATQVPLQNTVNDFWCMMYDYKCHTIVALNDPKKKDKYSVPCGLWIWDQSVAA